MKTYCIQPGLVLACVCGDNLLIPAGEAKGRIRSIRRVNDVGAYLWRMFEAGEEMEEIVRRCVKDYGVSEEKARTVLQQFTQELCATGHLIAAEEEE